MKYEVFTKPGCVYCTKAKKLLTDRYEDFDMIDVTAGSIEDQVLARERLIDRVVEATGNIPKTMPQIFADGHYIGGYDQLEAMFLSNESDEDVLNKEGTRD